MVNPAHTPQVTESQDDGYVADTGSPQPPDERFSPNLSPTFEPLSPSTVICEFLECMFPDHHDHPFLLDPTFPRFPSRAAALALLAEYKERGESLDLFDVYRILDTRSDSDEVVEGSVAGEESIAGDLTSAEGEFPQQLAPTSSEISRPSSLPFVPPPTYPRMSKFATKELKKLRRTRHHVIRMESRLRHVSSIYYCLLRYQGAKMCRKGVNLPAHVANLADLQQYFLIRQRRIR